MGNGSYEYTGHQTLISKLNNPSLIHRSPSNHKNSIPSEQNVSLTHPSSQQEQPIRQDHKNHSIENIDRIASMYSSKSLRQYFVPLYDKLPKSVLLWNSKDVLMWLQIIGLSALFPNFEKFGVDGSCVFLLDIQDFTCQMRIQSSMAIAVLMAWIKAGFKQYERYLEQKNQDPTNKISVDNAQKITKAQKHIEQLLKNQQFPPKPKPKPKNIQSKQKDLNKLYFLENQPTFKTQTKLSTQKTQNNIPQEKLLSIYDKKSNICVQIENFPFFFIEEFNSVYNEIYGVQNQQEIDVYTCKLCENNMSNTIKSQIYPHENSLSSSQISTKSQTSNRLSANFKHYHHLKQQIKRNTELIIEKIFNEEKNMYQFWVTLAYFQYQPKNMQVDRNFVDGEEYQITKNLSLKNQITKRYSALNSKDLDKDQYSNTFKKNEIYNSPRINNFKNQLQSQKLSIYDHVNVYKAMTTSMAIPMKLYDWELDLDRFDFVAGIYHFVVEMDMYFERNSYENVRFDKNTADKKYKMIMNLTIPQTGQKIQIDPFKQPKFNRLERKNTAEISNTPQIRVFLLHYKKQPNEQELSIVEVTQPPFYIPILEWLASFTNFSDKNSSKYGNIYCYKERYEEKYNVVENWYQREEQQRVSSNRKPIHKKRQPQRNSFRYKSEPQIIILTAIIYIQNQAQYYLCNIDNNMKNKYEDLERFLTEKFKQKEKNSTINSNRNVNFDTAQKLKYQVKMKQDDESNQKTLGIRKKFMKQKPQKQSQISQKKETSFHKYKSNREEYQNITKLVLTPKKIPSSPIWVKLPLTTSSFSKRKNKKSTNNPKSYSPYKVQNLSTLITNNSLLKIGQSEFIFNLTVNTIHNDNKRIQNNLSNSPQKANYDIGLRSLHQHQILSACIICYERQKNCIFMNCRHNVTCLTCGKILEICPLCRQPILDYVRLYTS